MRLESNQEAASNTGITWKELEATIQPRRAPSNQNPMLGGSRKLEFSPGGAQEARIQP